MSDLMALLPNILSSLDWRQPLWLLLALQPLFLWLILRWLQKYKQTQFADSHLLPWIQVKQKKKLSKTLFSRDVAYGLAWVLLALALAGPRVADDQQLSSDNGNEVLVDIMMVIDLSRSMHATDIVPSRLRRASLEAYELLSLVKNTRMGMVVYAARPHLFVPLTTDKSALKFYLQDLDSLQLPTKGSDANAVLAFAKKELQGSSVARKQVILWLTDGDIAANRENGLQAQIQQSADDGISTYILGLGTVEGSGVPLADGGWAETENGQGVVSKMKVALLQQLATVGAGQFVTVRDDNEDWVRLYQNGILKNVAKEMSSADSENATRWKQLYPWFLFPAILFLVLALFPVSVFSTGKLRHLLSIVMVAIGLNILLTLTLPSSVFAGDKAYASEVLQGIEAYKKSEYSKAKRLFMASVLDANTDEERAIALHNLGNTLFQKGDYATATELFTDALLYNPSQQQTINNHDLTLSLHTLLQKRLEKRRLKAKMKNQNATSEIGITGEDIFDLPALSPSTINTQTKSVLKFSLPEIPKEVLDKLLDKGMEHLQIMQGLGGDTKLQNKLHRQALGEARLYLQNLESNTSKVSNLLWKRLFEVEEGFPAKLEQPKDVPGILPW